MSDDAARLPAGTELLRTVRMTLRLNAPPERVSRAWADPEELARWFPDRVEGGLAVGARTVLVWENQRAWWDVIEARTGEVFSFRWPWLADEHLVTTVRVTFAPAGYGTLLELGGRPVPARQARGPRRVGRGDRGLERGAGETAGVRRLQRGPARAAVDAGTTRAAGPEPPPWPPRASAIAVPRRSAQTRGLDVHHCCAPATPDR